MKIQKVADRAKLSPRRDPYWHKVRKGCFLGYRKMVNGSSGNWIARCRDDATGKQRHHSIGEFGHCPESDRFDLAMKAAEQWFVHLDRGGSAKIIDVRETCERYLEHIERTKGKRSMADIERRFNQYVFTDADFCRIELTKLTPAHVGGWRKRLYQTPTKSGPQRGEKRAGNSLNRDMTCLRSALNFAFSEGLTSSDFAWKSKLRPLPLTDGQREIVINQQQRRALLDALPDDLSQLVMTACLLPLRPGAIAELKVKDFDAFQKVLTVPIDKSGGGRKLLLPQQAMLHFASACKNKLPEAYIFTQANGAKWNRHAWKKPFKKSVQSIGLPPSTVFYSLRHSLITELVHSGLDLLTLAQISGTSLKMIERHYGHLTRTQSLRALEKLAI